jgi:hypothetical protein
MFYGIMWFDARGIRPVSPPAGVGRGRGGASRRAGRSPERAPGPSGEGGGRARMGSMGGATGQGAQAGPQEALSHRVHRCRAAPDKGGAFLKRRRPLQAVAGMAARNRSWVWARGSGGPVWPGPGAGKTFVPTPGDGRTSSSARVACPLLTPLNPGLPPLETLAAGLLPRFRKKTEIQSLRECWNP